MNSAEENLRNHTLPPEAKQVLIAVNPRAGARSGRPLVEQLKRLLLANGLEVSEPEDLDTLKAAVERSVSEGRLRAVVAGGGDGTAALLANLTPPQTPLLLLPLGTENLLSRRLGLSASPAQACDTILRGVVTRLDAGEANGRLFLLMAGCGFDAEVVRRVHAERTGNIRRWSYAKPIWESLRSYEYPLMRVYCDLREGGGSAQGESRAAGDGQPILVRWAFVANLPCYAAGLKIVPDAVGDDGLLDLCAFRHGSLWHALRYLAGVVFAKHRGWTDCVQTRTRRLRMEADQQVPYQLDGDFGGFLPLEVCVLPGRVTLLTPPGRPPRR